MKTKNERRDALKLAQLSARNELELVHVPQSEVRQWRALIAYRQHLVQRRTKIKNHIRDLLMREGQLLPRYRSAWTQEGIANLEAMSRALSEVSMGLGRDGTIGPHHAYRRVNQSSRFFS